MLGLFKNRGIQVLLVIGIYLFIANSLPPALHQGFYTVSVFIKDLLVWLLPVTVGLFIAHTICSFEKRAPLFILALFLFEGISNFSSVWFALGGGHIAADFLPPIQMPAINVDFSPLWRLPFTKPAWWSADKGTLLGLVLGSIAIIGKQNVLRGWIARGKGIVQWILTRVFSRLIPLFILGFVARMHQTEILRHIFAHYAVLLVWMLGFLILYIFFLFLIGSGSWRGAFQSLKNLTPAGAIAFTSGCSLSTMPWTIEGAGKNLQNPEFAKAIIPATTNIQQIGDCIINTFLCFLIYNHFYGHPPDLNTLVNFTVMFVLARFATAAVIGGAIFIMLPIYETYLSFTPEMIAIILAFNVILDPIVTSSNVMANGALCRVFERVWMGLQRLLPTTRQQRTR
ncbi:MAG: cation:dicarboxylase symporter family transporter [Verrucomicrobia bacterium]|nr:cation:dicarboxylase symporter family transporter [Verrucomicrobiota bacterium]